MPCPVPTVDIDQELDNLWNAIAKYEQEVDSKIRDVADGEHGYIESMSYSADALKLTTLYKTLQATYDDDAIKNVGFPGEAKTSQLSHEAYSGSGASKITRIDSKESSDGVRLFVTVEGETKPREVFFNVTDAKGPRGPKGEDRKGPKDWNVDTSGTSSTLYGGSGSKVAEASAAFAKGSATGVSASITLLSVSATGISLSITLLDVGADGVFYNCKAAGGAAAHNETLMRSIGVYELDAQDVEIVLQLTKLYALKKKLGVIQNEAAALATGAGIENNEQ